MKTDMAMHASPGDRLVIRGHSVGSASRDAEIIDVLGEDGGPPYLVRWEDDGHVSRLYPGSDAYIRHFEHGSPSGARTSARPRSAPPAAGSEAALPSAADWDAAVPPRDS
jgi:hypothetical protein